jgi:anti-anti-sigma regulatory factor
VTFLDSSGIQSLIRIALEARTIGSTFSIADASVRARRVLELSGLGDLLEPVSPEAPSS